MTDALDVAAPAAGRRGWVFFGLGLGFGFGFTSFDLSSNFFFKSVGNVFLNDFNLAIASWAGVNLLGLPLVLVLEAWRSFLADATADALTLGNLVTVLELLLEAAAVATAAAGDFLVSGFPPNSACMTFETDRLGENCRAASVGFLWFPPDKGSTFDMTNDPFIELLVCTLLLLALGNCFLETPVLVKLTDGGKVTPLFDIVVFGFAVTTAAEDDNIEDFVAATDVDTVGQALDVVIDTDGFTDWDLLEVEVFF